MNYKNIITLILFIVAMFIAADMIPAETKGNMATVIHKSIIPVPVEAREAAKPEYIMTVWIENEYQPIRVVADKKEWDNIDTGDKLMVYFRDGWITGYNYSLQIQGNFKEL